MPTVQAISRLPIDSAPTDSRSMRSKDAFQTHLDQKLDSVKSKSDSSVEEPSKANSDRSIRKKTAPSESPLETDSIDSTQETDQPNQSETDELDNLTTDEKSDDDLSLSDESVESQKKNQAEEQIEIQDAMLLEAARLAIVANPEANSLDETSEQTESIAQAQGQSLKIQQPTPAIAVNQSENAKSIDSTKSVAKPDGQIDVSEFQPVESSAKSETDDSKHEPRDSKSFDEPLAKQQAKLVGEAAKPNLDQPKQEQADPARLTIDAVQSKSNESVVKAISIPHAPHTDPEVARSNVENIVSSVRAQLLPRGGSMQMRLDPPELGALTISMKLIDGRMTASFTTENSDATRMLSNNLGQLKSTLEAGGVQVHRLDVKTSSETFNSSRDDENRNQQKQSEGSWQQSEQQRREMVNRMWRRYAYGSDELDLVA